MTQSNHSNLRIKVTQQLFTSLIRDDWHTIRLTIIDGADVNARNSDNDTPLHIAARRGNIEAVKALIAAGAKIEPTNGRDTPLGCAANAGQMHVVAFLRSLPDSLVTTPTTPSPRPRRR